MSVDLDKLNFYSGVNYMKRSDKSGHSTINSNPILINHNFGYPPQFTYYVDIDGDGILWYGGERIHPGTDSTAGGGGTAPPIVDGWTDNNTLTLYPMFFTGARQIYWLIYLDYGA